MAGQVIVPPVQVDVYNSAGNVADLDASTVTLTLSSGVLNGVTTATAVNGVAVFSTLSISTPGAYTLTAVDGLDVQAISKTFSVTPVLHLAFATQPANSIAGATLAPMTVLIEDPSGDVVANNDSFVSLSPSAGSLAGVTTAQAVDGVAVFNDVSVTTSGSFTLSASAGQITAATSNLFTISSTPVFAGTLEPTFGISSLPLTVVAGEPTHGAVPIHLTNTTQTTQKGLVRVNLFASADETIDSSSVLLAGRSLKVNLKPGQSTMAIISVKSLPPVLAEGAYMLLPQTVDPAGNISDGVTGPPLLLQSSQAVLEANAGTVSPGSIHVNQSGLAPVTIINVGNTAFRGSVQIAMGLSTDGLTDADELTAVSRRVFVPAGASRSLYLRFVVTSPVPGGNYFPYVSITADGNTTPTVGSNGFTVVG